MFTIEFTPLVKTEIRPVPEAQILDQVYHVFLDKGVHFRVEQVNDESITFYWTRCSEYLHDCIVNELSEIASHQVPEQVAFQLEEIELPKIGRWTVDENRIEDVKLAIELLFRDAVNVFITRNEIVVEWAKDAKETNRDIELLIDSIKADEVRCITVENIEQDVADNFMRKAVHEHQSKIRRSHYRDNKLGVLIDNDPVVYQSLMMELRRLAKQKLLKQIEDEVKSGDAEQDIINYTGPKAKAINETLTTFYSSRIETKLEGEQLTIKLPLDDLSLGEEIRGLIDEIVDSRLRLLTVHQIGQEDADTFMRDIVHSYREKIRQSSYKDNTLSILLNYEPGLITKLEKRLRAMSLDRFVEDGLQGLFKGLFSDNECDCPECQKRR
ncbi:hypothetical protein LL200_000601 [Salmonella enterica]|nr:hypothetical protein [Salmonella enterica]